MNLTKEDLNQIRQIIKEAVKDEISPLKIDILLLKTDVSFLKNEIKGLKTETTNLREEIKIQTSNLRNSLETRMEKLEAQMMINNSAILEMKTEVIGIYKYINQGFSVYDRLKKPYGLNLTPPGKSTLPET